MVTTAIVDVMLFTVVMEYTRTASVCTEAVLVNRCQGTDTYF